MKKKTVLSKKFPINRILALAAGVFAVFFIYGAVRLIAAPVSINETRYAERYGVRGPLTNTPPAPPEGCYYQNVQCIQAPCNPVLVCSSSAPRPTPGVSCKPRPACLDQNPHCMLPETEDMCPAGSSAPAPTGRPTMSPLPAESARPSQLPASCTRSPHFAGWAWCNGRLIRLDNAQGRSTQSY
jgi:hypothetical protein